MTERTVLIIAFSVALVAAVNTWIDEYHIQRLESRVAALEARK